MVDYRTSKTTSPHLAAASGAQGDEHCRLVLSEDEIMARLHTAVQVGDIQNSFSIDKFARDTGASPTELFDHYIPDVARQLGEQWCSDELGFAEVTIGSARLQAMLRELSKDWSDYSAEPNDASTILLCVPEGTYHTMGAMVVSGQLRRRGLSVRLLLEATPQNIADSFDLASFDAVFVSAVRGESLETLRRIVDSVKTASGSAAPIVVGGTLLELEPDVAALTGADYVTNFADEAISLCNLRTKQRSTIASDS